MPNSASKVGHKQTVAYGRYKAANQAENRLADEIHTPITSEAGIGRRHHTQVLDTRSGSRVNIRVGTLRYSTVYYCG